MLRVTKRSGDEMEGPEPTRVKVCARVWAGARVRVGARARVCGVGARRVFTRPFFCQVSSTELPGWGTNFHVQLQASRRAREALMPTAEELALLMRPVPLDPAVLETVPRKAMKEILTQHAGTIEFNEEPQGAVFVIPLDKEGMPEREGVLWIASMQRGTEFYPRFFGPEGDYLILHGDKRTLPLYARNTSGRAARLNADDMRDTISAYITTHGVQPAGYGVAASLANGTDVAAARARFFGSGDVEACGIYDLGKMIQTAVAGGNATRTTVELVPVTKEMRQAQDLRL
jgi:hypothetical protein